jgi:predicted RNase H-like HicB family nuclease
VATVPALPGCHAQGKTLKELMSNVREVIQLCLSVAKDNPNYRRQIKLAGYEPTFIGVESVTI